MKEEKELETVVKGSKEIEKGKYDEKILIASNLLKHGVEVDIISKSSGLSKEEIFNIKEEM